MAQNSWPFENADTTEDQYSLLFGRYGKPGSMFMGVASQPNQTSAGSLQVYGDSSGMQVKVRSGFAIVRGFAYQNTTNGQTVAISAASSSPRIDLIVLNLDPSTNSIVLQVVEGSPSATPVAPSLTQNDTTGIYQMEIGRVLVPALATAIAPTDVTDTRPCLPVGAGVWTNAQRPAGVQGQMGWNTSLSQLEVYTGSAWQEVRPTVIDAGTITTGTLDPVRIAANSLADSKLFPTIGEGKLLIAQGAEFIGVAYPQMYYSGNVYNPTVGTAWTTTGPSLDTYGSNQFLIITGTVRIGSAAVDRVVSIRFQNGATPIVTFDHYVASGKVATVTCQWVLDTNNDPASIKMNYQTDKTTTTPINGNLQILGIY